MNNEIREAQIKKLDEKKLNNDEYLKPFIFTKEEIEAQNLAKIGRSEAKKEMRRVKRYVKGNY